MKRPTDEQQNRLIIEWIDALAARRWASLEDYARIDRHYREAIIQINAERARAMFELIERLGPRALGLMEQDEQIH